ncbi:TetR/AcrR family transcriptional regulator [Nocardia sp. NPDC058518]|uniref:TetR/AcrR family transcriptional regulator n=1 Tax=Nocardia sp. NPDC058518 TaxID=3346534 RepID=UPI003652EA91
MRSTDATVPPATAAIVLQLLAGATPTPLPRHRHDLSRDDVRETQRARVVATAIELFADHGYSQTNVQDITKGAGVSRKTFYELYANKEDVFLDAYQAVGVLIGEAGLGVDDTDDLSLTPETMIEYAQRLLLVMAFAPAATRMFFLEALGAGPRVRLRRNQAIDEFVTTTAPALRDFRTRYEPDLPTLTIEQCHVAVAACIELITQYLADHEAATLALLAPRLVDAVRAIVIPNYHSE